MPISEDQPVQPLSSNLPLTGPFLVWAVHPGGGVTSDSGAADAQPPLSYVILTSFQFQCVFRLLGALIFIPKSKRLECLRKMPGILHNFKLRTEGSCLLIH